MLQSKQVAAIAQGLQSQQVDIIGKLPRQCSELYGGEKYNHLHSKCLKLSE